MQGEGKALLRCINYHVSLVCIFALGVRVILAHLAVLIQNYCSCGQEVVFFLCMFLMHLFIQCIDINFCSSVHFIFLLFFHLKQFVNNATSISAKRPCPTKL